MLKDIRYFHKHTKLAIMALRPTLYFHFLKFSSLFRSHNVSKCKIRCELADFIDLFNFGWHSQNENGNIGTLVLWRDHKKILLRTMVEDIRYNRKFGIKLIESGERERIVGFLFSRLTSLYTYYPFLDHNIVSI